MATYTPAGGSALNFGFLIDPPTRRTEQQVSERLIFGSDEAIVDVIGKSVTKIIGRARIDSYASFLTFEGAVGTQGTLVYSEEAGGISVLFRSLERNQVTKGDVHICSIEFWIIGTNVTLRFLSLSASNATTGGTSLDDIISFSGSWGTDRQYSEAQLVFPALPAVTYLDEIEVTCGIVGGTIDTRFYGRVYDATYDPIERTVTVVMYGYLRMAVEYENWENPEFVGGLLPLDLTGSMPDTATNIINAVLLNKVQIPSGKVGSIGSSGVSYGTFFDAVIWRNGFNPDNPFLEEAGESAYSYFSRYDEVDADASNGRYRVIETVGSPPIQRVAVGKPSGSAAFTFTEGVDILAGSFSRNVEETRNYFVVTGYDVGTGTGPIFDQLQESNAYQGSTKHTKQLSSPMIENSTLLRAAGQTVGMGTDTVCSALAVEFNKEFVRGWIETFRADLIGLVQTHKIQGAGGTFGKLGVNENLYVTTVTVTCDERGFTQRMDYLA